jgi:ActR/RegA family two-component response regulator
LLIEDDAAMRQTLQRSLKRQNWLFQACNRWRRGASAVAEAELEYPRAAYGD